MSRGVYLTPPDYRRVNAAFLQAITNSRKGDKCGFPCEVLGAVKRRNFACTIICPMKQREIGVSTAFCLNGGKRELSHADWIGIYRAWLETMAKTFEDARQKLERWKDFMRLDNLLLPDKESQKRQPSEAFLRVMRKMEEWEDEDKRVDTD